MRVRFSVNEDTDNGFWFIVDSMGLKPTGGCFDTHESAVKYCEWLEKWIKD